MWIGHRKEIRELTFRALALRRSESNSNPIPIQNESNSNPIRSDEGLALETLAPESLYGGQFTLSTQLIINNYSPKAKWILVNMPRDEVKGNIYQYSRAWGE